MLKMSRQLVCTVLVSLLIPMSSLAANGIANGYHVLQVRVDRNGLGIVIFDQNLTTPTACQSGFAQHMSFDTRTDGGRSALGVALAAQTTGKRVYAYGAGACYEYTNAVESWLFGQILEN